MNSTNLLLGTTGGVLAAALLFSFTQMNAAKKADPSEIAELRAEIQRLELARTKLQQNNTNPSLIFPPNSYDTPTTPVATKDVSEEKLEELQKQIAELTESQQATQTLLNRPAPEPKPEPEPIIEESIPELVEEPTADPNQEKRSRLINQAILQATIQTWDSENWLAVLEPTGAKNFEVGDELALRRNGGILCTFYVSSAVSGQYIADLKSTLAKGAPEIVVGDELIIPLIYDGELD